MSAKQPKQQHSNELSCDGDKPERELLNFCKHSKSTITDRVWSVERALHNFVDVNGMAEEKENNS